jgi:parallel beta-helix repeat protein
MEGCGLYVLGVALHNEPIYIHMNSIFFDHSIDIDNQVNGKHIYYYKNELDLNLNNFSNAGQVILFNCSNAVIENLNLSFTSTGLQLISCNDCKVDNNTLNNNTYDGLYMVEGSDNEISNNVANHNGNIGINFEASNYNTITKNQACGNLKGIANDLYWLQNNDYNVISDNIIENNSNAGILLYQSSHNIIILNEINGNLNGIHLKDCHESYISYNNIDNNLENGIYLYMSNDNRIFENQISQNNIGIFLYYSENNVINNNYFFGNNLNEYIISDMDFIFLFFLILIMIIIFIGLGGSIVAVSRHRLNTGRDFELERQEESQEFNQDEIIFKIPSSNTILKESTNKELLIEIFDPDKTHQEMSRLSEDILLSAMSETFLDKVDKLGLNESDKKEFLMDMFSYKPSERHDIVDRMLSNCIK